MAGSLYVVATPIGNLEDLTFRALRVLKEVDLIAAEDTRRTAKLLAHYEIRKPLVSVREHNEAREAGRLVSRIATGASIALVTDAGTPGISDPGARVVAAARAAGVRVVPIPGPSAVTTALSVSGFDASAFSFMGFPPRSGRERAEWFANLKSNPGVVVMFESPHRAERTLGELAKYEPIRKFLVLKELTKIHETMVMSPIVGLGVGFNAAKGEFVIVAGPRERDDGPGSYEVDAAKASDIIGRLTDAAGFDEVTAIRVASMLLGADEAILKKFVKKYRISVNQRMSQSP